MKLEEFMKHCTACGGNWTAMLATGLQECFPDEFAKLPETFQFGDVTEAMKRAGVDMSDLRESTLRAKDKPLNS